MRCLYRKRELQLMMRVAMVMSLTSPFAAQAQVQNESEQDKSQDSYQDKFLSAAAQLVRGKAKLSKIWPGYWPENQTFIIYHRDYGALLISDAGAPEPYKALSEKEVPEELTGIAYFQKGPIDNINRPFYLDYDIGDGRKTILANYSSNEVRLTQENIISFLLHEQFHSYQNTDFIEGDSAFIRPLDIKNRVEYAATVQVEMRLLAAVVSAPDKKRQMELLGQYFAARRTRESVVLESLAVSDRYFERIEGGAEYAEQIGLSKLKNEDDFGLRQRFIKKLQKDLITVHSGPYMGAITRAKSYTIGSALAYLISQYDDGDWRKEIEKGAILDQYLEKLIDTQWQNNSKELAEAARKTYGYDAIYNQYEPIIKANEQTEIKSVSEFFALHPFRLLIDLEDLTESLTTGFSGANMVRLEPNKLAIEQAYLLNRSGSDFDVTVKNRPVLISKNIDVLLDELPEIIGHTGKAVGIYQLDSIKILNDNLDIQIDRKATLTIEENQMTIKIIE